MIKNTESYIRTQRKISIVIFCGFFAFFLLSGLIIYNAFVPEHELKWYVSQSIASELECKYDNDIFIQIEEIKDYFFDEDDTDGYSFKCYIATVYEDDDTGEMTADKWICCVWYKKINGDGSWQNRAYYDLPDTNVARIKE